MMAIKKSKFRSTLGPAVNSDIALSTLNKRHFVVCSHGFISHKVQGNPIVGTDWGDSAIPVSFMTFEEFRQSYSDWKVKVKKFIDLNKSLAERYIPLGGYWLDHPERRNCPEEVFDLDGVLEWLKKGKDTPDAKEPQEADDGKG